MKIYLERIWSLAVFISIIAITANAQVLKVNIKYNDFEEINLQKINTYKAFFNKTLIESGLQSNPHITDKNLNIEIVFFHRMKLGEVRLKATHVMSPDDYEQRWREDNDSKSGILLLFVKNTHDETEYSFNRMVVSNYLEAEYLPPLVSDYMSRALTGNTEAIISQFARMLQKALLPVWNADKMERASTLVNHPKYLAGRVNFFHNWFKFGFFDLEPATASETNNMILVNAWTASNANQASWFFSDKYIFTDTDKLQGFDVTKIYDWGLSFEKDAIKNVYIFKDAYLYNILKYLEELQKHNASTIASTWDWDYDRDADPPKHLSSLSGFAPRSETDRLILYFDQADYLQEGDPIPKLAPTSENTWCNIFACDLSNEVLFGNIFGDIHNGPWGSNQCASGLHYRIYHDDINFKEVSLTEAWKYTMKGYVVYLSMLHFSRQADLINTTQQESSLCSGKSGHISVCYPQVDPNNTGHQNCTLIQAGSSVGKVRYFDAFGTTNDNKIKAHIYLGYLIN